MSRPVLQASDDVKHFVDVAFYFDFGPDLADDALFVDCEGGALDAHVFPAVVILLFPDVVSLDYGLVFVGQEREGEVVFFGELLVAG